MKERNPLDQIRASLQKGNMVDLLKGDTRLPGEKRTDLEFSNTPSTGRAEVPIHPEQLRSLSDKVDLISNWLYENGLSGKNLPDYQIRIDEEINTPEQIEKTYYLAKPPFEASAKTYEGGWKLSLQKDIEDKKAFVDMTFEWDSAFALGIEFSGIARADEPESPEEIPEDMKDVITEENWEYAKREIEEFKERLRRQGTLEALQDFYYSGERLIDEMNDEEYALIDQCLDEFTQLAGIHSPTTSEDVHKPVKDEPRQDDFGDLDL